MISAARRKIVRKSPRIDPLEGRRWIQEGRQMAQQEGPAAFESIQIHHGAELVASEAQAGEIKAGIVTLIVLGRKGPHGFPFRRPHSQFPIH